MSLECSEKISLLQKRAHALRLAREFFFAGKYVEVDVPSLVKYPAVDAHIDSMEVQANEATIAYLHTSPEYLMKRLVALGIGKIYQISHVFRKEELGRYHNPEFTMVEWYNTEINYEQMIAQTLDFCTLYLEKLPIKYLTYKAAFKQYLDIDPFTCSSYDLKNAAGFYKIHTPDNLSKDGWLQLLFTHFIEPHLSGNKFYVVHEFPSSQAALAKTVIQEGVEVAKRFEIYCKGVELANGYFELCDGEELMERFQKENFIRQANHKKSYPIDPKFIAAHKNLSPFCGVSVGFDRLLMLQYKKDTLQEVLPFSWEDL